MWAHNLEKDEEAFLPLNGAPHAPHRLMMYGHKLWPYCMITKYGHNILSKPVTYGHNIIYGRKKIWAKNLEENAEALLAFNSAPRATHAHNI